MAITASYSCPNCGGASVLMIGRIYSYGDHATRMRQCKQCGIEWKTVEIDADMYESIIGRKAK